MADVFLGEWFRIVSETMVDGLIVIDGAGRIIYINPACQRLFGHPVDGLIGNNVSMLMPRVYAEKHDEYLARTRNERVKRIIGVGRELTGLRADGAEFPMYLSVGEAAINDGVIFVGIIYDLTDKKRAEETILHHQKLDAIGQLSGGIAHDFNNILSVIGGNLELVAQLDLPPAARRAITRAQEAVTRGARITQRLLAFARKQPLASQTLDANKVVSDLSELLRRTLGTAITVQMNLEAGLPPVDADIDQFETAILNLALNSRDAMPEGGALTIDTEFARFDDAPASRDEVPPGEYVRVSVTDSGTGMTEDVRRRAIDPFFTTKETGAGTGLGLSMVHGFMKQIGGQARLYSEPGIGTRVSLFFPASAGTTESADAGAEAPPPRGSGEVVLVVEDDADVRAVTVGRLESLGYGVRVAVDAENALRVLEAAPDVSLALVDVVMPGRMDGHALAEEINHRWPHLPIVITSGYSEKLATRAANASRRPFLSKPASLQRLAQIVSANLDKERRPTDPA